MTFEFEYKSLLDPLTASTLSGIGVGTDLMLQYQRPSHQHDNWSSSLGTQTQKCGTFPIRKERVVARARLHRIQEVNQSKSSVEAECSMLTSAC